MSARPVALEPKGIDDEEEGQGRQGRQTALLGKARGVVRSKILPPGMSFLQAFRAGYVGRIEDERYLAWVRTLPCCCCGGPGGVAHHPYSVIGKGAATKVPDYLAIPMHPEHHERLHASVARWEAENGAQLHHAALTMLQAIHEGVLERP